MSAATGASRAATGTITANSDSTLTLTPASDCTLVTNESGVTFALRINGAVSATMFDAKVATGERLWITDIVVATIHVYGNAPTGVRVVAW